MNYLVQFESILETVLSHENWPTCEGFEGESSSWERVKDLHGLHSWGSVALGSTNCPCGVHGIGERATLWWSGSCTFQPAGGPCHRFGSWHLGLCSLRILIMIILWSFSQYISFLLFSFTSWQLHATESGPRRGLFWLPCGWVGGSSGWWLILWGDWAWVMGMERWSPRQFPGAASCT